MNKTYAIILSGGTGNRVGSSIPKQYIDVGGKPVISYCMETIFAHDKIDGVYIVADAMYHNLIAREIDKLNNKNIFCGFAAPGINRQLSIYNALQIMKDTAGEDDIVIIHDAARPMVSEKLITDCIDSITGHDGVMPAFQVKDTVYVSKDGKRVSSLLNRSEIYAGQAPEVFRYGKYFEANEELLPDRILLINGSTEPAIIAGLDIVIIAGDEDNFKITTKGELDKFEDIIRNGK